ncbi:MAG TPA: isoprenylcysteine carboxylmethyltransferase family protein [Desulfuromonadaceae bacterium]|jgi:protein-S-isoprenylcysteine O-methyltransferase Ste14
MQRSSLLPDYTFFLIRFMIFAIIHSLLASKLVKNWVTVLTGRELRFYRLSYNLISFVMFGWVMAAYRNSPVLYYAPGAWSLALYLAQLMIVLILFNCMHQTGWGAFLGIKPLPAIKTSEQLVATGWYSCVRHPLYFFSVLFMVLNPVMTLQWLMLTIFTAIYFTAGALIEEHRLLAQFGHRYRCYQKNVPFIIPNLKKLKKPTNA